jgi:hypothetical protein
LGEQLSPVAIGAAVFFSGWLGLSLAGQLLPRDSWLRRTPISWFIPDWRFFAPEPGTRDHQLWYRIQPGTGAADAVATVTMPPAGALRWLWNPSERRHKALLDLADILQRAAEHLGDDADGSELPDSLLLTEPYLTLLNVVSARRLPTDGGLIQFGIIRHAWPDREELVFVSRWHALLPAAH